MKTDATHWTGAQTRGELEFLYFAWNSLILHRISLILCARGELEFLYFAWNSLILHRISLILCRICPI